MDFEQLFENIDYLSPLTDEELDYLDIIGDTPIMVDGNMDRGFSSTKEFVEFVKKDLDIFDAPGVQLVNINELEISGS